MALDSAVAFVNTDAVAFPDNAAVNASGPLATDGTEFVKVMIDNYMFGRQQALLSHAALVPSGISEASGAGNSQEIEAMQKSFGAPGESVKWFGNNDPGSLGNRILLLQGQGILVANYPELDTNVYTGDPNNPTAVAFYHADDAAGTIRNTAGAYLILPDVRGKFLRCLDDTGLIDVDGGGLRLPGDAQAEDVISHGHFKILAAQPPGGGNGTPQSSQSGETTRPTTNGTFGGTETRPTNVSAHFGIRY